MNQEFHPARTEVMGGIFRLAADVAEQAGEQGAVNGVVSGRDLVLFPLMLSGQSVQLAVNITPLAHTQCRQEIFMAGLDQLTMRFFVLQLAFVPVPQLEPGEEF